MAHVYNWKQTQSENVKRLLTNTTLANPTLLVI